jgi:predicted metal-dependent hydrolase
MPSTKPLEQKLSCRNANSVSYGTREIAFDLEYSDRQTLGIEVHPNQRVLVKAPTGASISAIQSKVSNRASWIARQQRQFSTYAATLPAPEYVSGEGYRYLGRQCRLKVIKSDEKIVRLWAGRLEVHTPEIHQQDQIERLVNRWYRDRAQQIFSERYQACVKIAAQYGITHEQGFDLRNMEKRWGSCSIHGKIKLNPLLVSAPKDCIDYVIMHELCHLRFHNHSVDFYRLLSNLMPDWQKRKDYLNTRIELRQGLV